MAEEMIAVETGLLHEPAADTSPKIHDDSETSATVPEADESIASPPQSPNRKTTQHAHLDGMPTIPMRGGDVDATPTTPFASLQRASPAAASSPGNIRARQTGGGLSELSKQLRILQAKNESQSVEIDRLERQLKILAELQGVSVGGLRSALEQACESEALAEMHSRVASLQAQLEAATIAREPSVGRSGGGSSLQDEAMAKNVANLELRLGELEEIDEKQRAEAQQLYTQLGEQKTSEARLEAQVQKLGAENEDLAAENKRLIAEKEALATSKDRDVELTSSAAAELVDDEKKRRTEVETKLKVAANKATAVETELNIVRERLALTEQQKSSSEEQGNLRSAQYKARFTVQEGNIKDLEQQLSSLYVAFTMLKEERNEEVAERQALQSNLDEADAEVARRLEQQEQRQRQSVPMPVATPAPPRPTPPIPREQIPVLTSDLLVEGSGRIRPWKKQHASLVAELSHHILDVGLGETYNLFFSVASVEPHADQRHGFTVYLNRTDRNAPVLKLAALNSSDYEDWMAALALATDGVTPGAASLGAEVAPPALAEEFISPNANNSGLV